MTTEQYCEVFNTVGEVIIYFYNNTENNPLLNKWMIIPYGTIVLTFYNYIINSINITSKRDWPKKKKFK
jgi:hypothetical protein